MLPMPNSGPMQALERGNAFSGSGGSALLQAVLAHRGTQRGAAAHKHPHTLPVAYPMPAPGNPLMAALGQQQPPPPRGTLVGR